MFSNMKIFFRAVGLGGCRWCYVNGVYENLGGGGKGRVGSLGVSYLLQNPSGMIKFFLDHSLYLQAL